MSQTTAADYAVRLIGLDGDEAGILAFVGEHHQAVCEFIEQLVEAMFPPMSRGSSLLSAQTTEHGLLIFEARGGGALVSIRVPRCPPQIGVFIKTTLERYGSIAIVFGVGTTSDGSDLHLIQPSGNYFVKTDAFLDDGFINGSGRKDWGEELLLLEDEIPTLPMIPTHPSLDT